MYGRERESKSKNQSGSLIYIAVFVVLMLLSGGISGPLLALIIGVAVIGAVGYLAFYFGKKYLKNKQEGSPRPRRAYTNHQNHKPRAYNPGEIRDQDNLRRLQQLDSFLENGLIDRKEYNVLRTKYERYMRENENS